MPDKQPGDVADKDGHHYSADEASHQESPREKLTILPPSEASEEELRAPYANEFMQLSFEGRQKPPPIYKDWKKALDTPTSIKSTFVEKPKKLGPLARLKQMVIRLFWLS